MPSKPEHPRRTRTISEAGHEIQKSFRARRSAGFSIAVNTENAARNGSRVESRGGDGSAAAIESLAPFVRDNATATTDGETTTVTVEIPIVLPQITSENFAITRTATLPSTN
jgi:hypothetical protein